MKYYYHCNGCGKKDVVDEEKRKETQYQHRNCSTTIGFFEMVEFHICGDCKSYWPRFDKEGKYLGRGWCWNAADDVKDGHTEENCFKKRPKGQPAVVLKEGEVAQPPAPEPPKKKRR